MHKNYVQFVRVVLGYVSGHGQKADHNTCTLADSEMKIQQCENYGGMKLQP